MIPIWLKIVHTAFVAVLVPIYWRHYGPANFLWFSDIAQFLLIPALWLESPLLASVIALAIMLPELAWNLDFFGRLVTGRALLGLSDYMFDRANPRFIRALSLFHVALPPLIVWLVYRLGYDRRALLWQTVLAAVVLPVSYAVSDPRENVNWVYGFGSKRQTRIPGPAFVVVQLLLFVLVLYLPVHLLLGRLFGR